LSDVLETVIAVAAAAATRTRTTNQFSPLFIYMHGPEVNYKVSKHLGSNHSVSAVMSNMM
jgi:hypothetical protein